MMSSVERVRVTLVRSLIGSTDRQRASVRTLGLHRLHQSVELDLTPSVSGCIRKVNHLVRVESC